MHRHDADARLNCQCGTVKGLVTDASPRTVNRVVCYCDDCQAFARFLGRPDLLDQAGGSDIIQIAASHLTIHTGKHNIRGVRLSDAGAYRWYACCCNTPLGNMANMTTPALGIHSAAFREPEQNLDLLFGQPLGGIRGEYAIGDAPPGSSGVPVPLMLRAVPKVLMWKVRGKGSPNPFVSQTSKEILFPVETLAKSDREALGL